MVTSEFYMKVPKFKGLLIGGSYLFPLDLIFNSIYLQELTGNVAKNVY